MNFFCACRIYYLYFWCFKIQFEVISFIALHAIVLKCALLSGAPLPPFYPRIAIAGPNSENANICIERLLDGNVTKLT